MTIQEQLHIIQKVTGLTQTKLAERFGVSFAAFTGWWTGSFLPNKAHSYHSKLSLNSKITIYQRFLKK